MKKTQFTESQIIKALKEHEGGRKAKDICRELNVSRAIFFGERASTGVWRPPR